MWGVCATHRSQETILWGQLFHCGLQGMGVGQLCSGLNNYCPAWLCQLGYSIPIWGCLGGTALLEGILGSGL